MFTAVANWRMSSSLQTESREVVAFKSFVSIFQNQGFFILQKKKDILIALFSLETAANTQPPLWSFMQLQHWMWHNTLDRLH